MEPALSVVIPTLGRPTLDTVLDALAAQRGAERFEVLVVEDPAGEGARVSHGGHSLLRAGRTGASAARNAGWRAAGAPVVLFLGDDVVPAPRLVAEHQAWHAQHPEPEVAVLGHVRWASGLRVTPFMRFLDEGTQFDFGSICGIEADPGKLYTANVSLKRELLERAGGFDEERFPFLMEDIELAIRLVPLGLRLLYNRRAVGDHRHPVTLEDYQERMRAVARAERMLVATHPQAEDRLHRRYRAVLEAPSPRGRLAPLARWVPERAPFLGSRAWASARAVFERRLAEAFVDEWERSG